VQTSSFYLRPYCRADKAQVVHLLRALPQLYPDGRTWLDTRLSDVLDGKARCTLIVTASRVIGVTIETPKGYRDVKLSTICVDPTFRRRGIGLMLMAESHRRWLRDGIDRAYITADHRVVNSLYPLLARFGFYLRHTLRERYGEGRDEAVFCWAPK
jgi:ribosomal protein S18 acetylase RimI-like enzyme